MGAALALGECGQCLLLVVLRRGCFLSVVGIHLAPAKAQYLFARNFELDIFDTPQDGRCCELAVGIERGNEAAGNKVVDVALHVAQCFGHYPCGYDGMVVGHFRAVEHLFRLFQWLAAQRLHELRIRSLCCEGGFVEAVHHLRTLAIDVVGEVLSVYARIGGQLSLVESLYEVERCLSRISELAVTFHLQRGEVEELFGGFGAVLLLHVGHGEGLSGYRCEGLLALFFARELAFRGGEGGLAVYGGKHPVGFGLEVVDLALAVHYQCQRGSLHAAHAQRVSGATVLGRIQARGIDAEQPVAYGACQSGHIQVLIIGLVAQLLEPFAYGFVGH